METLTLRCFAAKRFQEEVVVVAIGLGESEVSGGMGTRL